MLDAMPDRTFTQPADLPTASARVDAGSMRAKLRSGIRRPSCGRSSNNISTSLPAIRLSSGSATPRRSTTSILSMVLGGDGSMLRAAHAMGNQQLPVLGVNLGQLGFLADLQPEQLEELLPQVAAGDYRVVSHLMFECDGAPRRGRTSHQCAGAQRSGSASRSSICDPRRAALR